ncbi:glycerol-3-phosphate 1-O-acyltransferase [Pseudonocardia abyssalis]|uniref:Glycerol-3-phosphate 1-O-acyltransferase n=1 Tax=Pseudonocardia abyssalis TaxID=2792008 RepID=A0ABS6URQ1_9PSEU|nr:glycerol-3-phosphate 1-O-acyltransferase [Pseudonocardia abyssalis]MBW0118059.1 glycerol-3-phosphate 1-O-acyltransferase [Pseudonocardia abyssalis]MBW0134548.1 glycerol-3-phosphate 1-O-acyltransferase [Pseudonocardia abyssalis]
MGLATETGPVQPSVGATEDSGASTILLVQASTDVERGLISRWAQESGLDPVQVLPLHGPALTRPLADADGATVVTAARVAWLPRERNGVRRVRWADLASLTDPRRPPARQQARIARREPDRAPVVVAEPATVAELRARHGGGGDLGRFVAGQATLALERAERSLVGDRYKVPKQIVEMIEDDPAFRREVTALAERLELPEVEVAGRAHSDLEGLVASMSPMAVDLLSGALRPLHARAWDVQVDTAGLERLRELNRRDALVFLPSHRSYADPLLLADVLAEHDFPRNHVLGGENLRFWPVGPVAKRAGVVFIRRSFGDDEVYKLAVREYFGFLLSKRFNLEWYMEGGRSRTGKLRPPKFGLLANVAEAVERGRVSDVHLVPVSITYDQLREVAAMAAEQAGAAKQGEGVAWLARYARAQLSQIGTAQVRFAEPISLRAALDAGPDRRLALQKAAFEVAVGINRVTPVMATALVTLALLGVRDRALTLGQVRRVLAPVREYVLDRDLPHSGDALDTDAGVRGVLAALAASRVVTTYAGGEEPVYAIERGQHLVAAFYRNSAIHHFVDRAVAELVLLSPPEERWDFAFTLRDLLKFEFFFPDRDTYRDRLTAELERLDPGWETAQDGRTVLARAPFLMAHRVLRSFVDAQLVVAERLAARVPRNAIVEKEFLDECTGVGQQMLLQGRLHGPESLSRELFASALRLAGNLDLVDPGREELGLRRADLASRLRAVLERVITIDELDAASRREVVGVAP